ncbi:predicted protein [Chaetomium globosum CBS 148.51]|uniref:Uncharacterized protein n=1 Tax=Chaetomium globosum (strain ATCC 6205 / CBS 148.51 / DSM 1962 / NBRC 6347 / NRRL 1970) TaxID=306901 RepID=Q2GXG0_CHAGB|nr:uncharacterized protein CHGG_07344 [Chaetomium globosum CBS 148.51]EAQ86091.1 predicted protein [Chaetomium globosum CBS 148.51]
MSRPQEPSSTPPARTLPRIWAVINTTPCLSVIGFTWTSIKRSHTYSSSPDDGIRPTIEIVFSSIIPRLRANYDDVPPSPSE